MKKKLIIIAFLTASLASCGKKVEDNTCKEYKDKVDLLQNEITLIGGKLDSMILLHDYGFAFTK